MIVRVGYSKIFIISEVEYFFIAFLNVGRALKKIGGFNCDGTDASGVPSAMSP